MNLWLVKKERDIAYCAANVKTADKEERINGVLIEVPAEDRSALDEREAHYDIEITRFSGPDGSERECLIYISRDYEDRPCDFSREIQQRYLNICLDGCGDFGTDFVKSFKQTTWVDGRRLAEHLA